MRSTRRLHHNSSENRTRGTPPSFQNPYSNYDLPLLRLREVESYHHTVFPAHRNGLGRGLGGGLGNRALNSGSRLQEQSPMPTDKREIGEASLDDRIAKALENVKFAPVHQRPQLSCNVANLLFTRYCRTGAAEDLDHAIQLAPKILQENSRSLGRYDVESEAFGAVKRSGFRDRYPHRADDFKENQDPSTTFYGTPEIGRDQSPFAPAGRMWSSLVTGEYIDEHLALVCQNNLACYLSERYLHSGYKSDIEEAILMARRVIKHKNENKTLQAARTSNLAVILGDKYSHDEDILDLQEALSLMTLAVSDTPQNDPARGIRLNNLATLVAYMEACGNTFSDSPSAMSLIQEAASPSLQLEPENTATIFYNFARLHHERSETNGWPEDLETALNNYWSSLNHPYSLRMTRILAGRGYLSLPNCLQDANRAFEVAETCIDLISKSAPYYLNPADKLRALSQVGEMVADAVAVALHLGKSAFSALELLETGRGVIISSLQNLRADTSSLDHCESELVQRFNRLRTKFDGSRAPLMPVDKSQFNNEHPINGQVNRRQHHQNLSEVIEEIRGTAMVQKFFSLPSKFEMMDAARKGPIVVINASIHRCDAIVIQSTGISNLPLPLLTLEGIRAQNQDKRSCEVLEWLWEIIVCPVLESLNMNGPLFKDQPLPHIWWVPTGPITGLPLHAAGYHFQKNCETALDKVVSSFSLSVTTIVRTRQRKSSEASAEFSKGVQLLVAPDPPGKETLPHAVHEAQGVREACESMKMPCVDIDSVVHMTSVQAINSCAIFHYIGHADVDMQNPLQSSLVLSASEITVQNLLDVDRTAEPPFLAYLSACGTSQGNDTGLANENIHLAAVFQLSGFRHAIATLWEVEDKLCGDMSKRIYQTFGEDGLNDDSVSKALHDATCELRDQWVLEKNEFLNGEWRGKRKAEADDREQEALWVPYVHFGV